MPRDGGFAPPRGRAVVIGAGFGGIAAALRARRLGYAVTIVDRMPATGGRARVFRQDGFTFDAGPTVITAPQLMEELFALFGERMADHVEMLPVRPWYRILFADGRWFDYGSSPEEMRDAVAAFAPGDVDGYDRLMQRSRALYEVGFDRYGAHSFATPGSMLRALPALVRLGGYRSVSGLVGRYLKDPALRRVFSLQPLLVGGHPFRTPAIYALIPYLEQRWGVWFPRGGTGALVAALEALMVRQGIEVQCGRTATRILVESGRTAGVAFEDGGTLAADIVIANADAPQVHAVLAEGIGPSASRVDRMDYSFGLFVMCFGTDRCWPEVAHHTIMLGERWKALLDEIFDGASVPDDPSLYLHRPAATDPSLQPLGCDGFYVLAPVPNIRAGIDWERAARTLRDRVVTELEARVLPGLSQHIVTERIMTPVDFAHDYLSRHGAGFSVAPTLLQSAWLRFHNRGALAGLYLAGAGTHPGAGLPGVLTSAKVVENVLAAEAAR
jgi:phytoene desaturase